jgi:hypothetical protein
VILKNQLFKDALKEIPMKKILVPLILSLCIAQPVYGQSTQEEAIDSLTTAQQFVKDGNFSKATEEINYALAKINELTAAALLEYIPEPPQGYSLVSKQSQGVGAGVVLAGNAGATANYSHSNGGTLDLNIAIGGMTGKMGSLAALGTMFAGLSQDGSSGQTRQVRVQGYTGTETFDSNRKSGTLTFQVGQKTSVTITGGNIDSAEILMQLAKNIDFSGIEKSL